MPNIPIRPDTVIQITVVESEPERQNEVLQLMGQRAHFMAEQPGCISISLHRSRDGRRIVNYVHWQNEALLHAAHRVPAFRQEWERFDHLTERIDPHLYEIAESVDSAPGNRTQSSRQS